MARFEVIRHTASSPQETWLRLTDWPRHGDHIPLTSVRLDTHSSPLAGVGSGFVARTSIGPLGFDDAMEVTWWQPPGGDASDAADQPSGAAPLPLPTAGMCRLRKRGRVVTGWAVLTVTATAEGSVVSWLEDIHIRGAGGWLDWPLRLAGARAFGRVVDGLLRDA